VTTRILLVTVGLVIAFVGYVAWAIEAEYGSGTNFRVESQPDGTQIVYDVDEQAQTSTPVLEGSKQEASAYMERRRAEGESFIVPGLVIALGGVLALVGFLPFRKGGT
jgi:hypothetical protein